MRLKELFVVVFLAFDISLCDFETILEFSPRLALYFAPTPLGSKYLDSVTLQKQPLALGVAPKNKLIENKSYFKTSFL